jgi:calcium binding protein 39
MNFFKPKTKSPSELVKVTREAIVNLEKDPANKKQNEKASEDITKNLRTMKFILYGDSMF